ncbi:chorismate mutase AroH [Spirochaetia bacterium]|nr:chorismate mutase AroH [Spirochaetia bacterium]
MSGEKRLFALRGAVQCLNTVEDMQVQVTNLYKALLERNNLAEDDIVSIIFSLTADLDAKNPASCLRAAGFAQERALFVTQEAACKGGMERIVRVLIHAYLRTDSTPKAVYQNGAQLLRPDLLTKS